MDRPLGKKFDPRPKRIQRSDGSYWIANPCVSEHFLTKEIGNLERQKTNYSARQNREQQELQKELQNIKATKSYRPGPGYFRRRGSRQHSMVETSFSDMIEKFNKRRVEQNFVNNLMKQRRESMYNISNDSKRCRSTNHLWDGAVKTKVDILQLDVQTNTDEEDVCTSQTSGKKSVRRNRSKRENAYIVSPNDCHSDMSENASSEETTIKLVARVNRKPSYVTDRGNIPSTTNSKQNVSNNEPLSKTKTRSAANLWGLVREKALEPGDLKRYNAQKQERMKQNDAANDNSKTYLNESTTDDQKLMEKEQETTKSQSGMKYYGNVNNKGKSNSSESDEREIKSEKELNEGKLNDKQKYLKKNKSSKKSNKHSQENQIPNNHRPKSKTENSRHSKASIVSSRPKSAKGRVRKSTVNSKNHSETIKNALVTIVNEMKDIIQDDHDTQSENRNQSPSGSMNIPTNGDDASLNNYLHSELSEHDMPKTDNRKLSEFDLSIDDHFPERRRSYGKQDGVFRIRHIQKENKGLDGEILSNESCRYSNDSRRTSAHSCRSSTPEHDSEKVRQAKLNDELWDDVRKCRYLRGYDPPDMIMPANVNVFVFGKDENDIIEEIRQEKQKEMEQEINQK